MFEIGDYVKLLPCYSDDNTYKIKKKTSVFQSTNPKLTSTGKPDLTIENILTKNSLYCSEDCLVLEQKYYRKKKIDKICSRLETR